MPDRDSFKKSCNAHLKSAKILMRAEDWEAAAYMLGHALECALKALICNKLQLSSYPEKKHFKTHEFVELKVLAGLNKIFSPSGNADEFNSWSAFISEYPDNWVSMRYQIPSSSTAPRVWDETKVKSLYNNLTDPQTGVLRVIKKRW
ncbi:hypothetical protein DOJK_00037 [Patescibacteria group bacterium]|nr:HEPN domain-containing protein [Candidatus Dojkabacteria bacterium]CAG1020046.1 hypothetical protein DOJK_00037 [Patescibacteria group bacterium]